jgi:uncharacterized membrane protein YebE (DUF533 family)
MNAFDILGSLMQGGMKPTAGRLQDVLGRLGPDVLGGMLGGTPAGQPQAGGAGALFDILGKVAGPMLGGGASGAGGGGLPFDMLKQIGGAVFGGPGGPAMPGAGSAAAGAGAMAMFGAIAAQALEMAKGMMAGGGAPGASAVPAAPGVGRSSGGMPNLDIDDATALIAGFRQPANPQEEQQVLDLATLTIRAMINAAKADGEIDAQEAQRLLGKMQEDGVTEEERSFVLGEMQKPMETDAIARAVPNQQVAAQIYTASLMAIQVDTDAERAYLKELAAKLGLNQQAVAYVHRAVGVA